MTIDTFRRYAQLDPASSQDVLPDWSSLAPVLLEAIDERTRPMQTRPTKTRPPAVKRPRFKGPLVAGAVFALVVLIIGVAFILSQDDVQPDVIDAPETTALEQGDRWAEAMNRGDLDGALALLSPEANCDLPVGEVETCEQHLGYLVAIGTRFEKTSCTEVEPIRCFYQLTSDLHSTLGYPEYSLPMDTAFEVDDSGLLVADFFSTAPVTSYSYWPDEAGDLWSFMLPDHPEIVIDRYFGSPNHYDQALGIAAMDSAARFNDPARIFTEFQTSLDRGFLPSVPPARCALPEGTVDCNSLFEFLLSISAGVELNCDYTAAAADTLVCPLTIDSDIHSALGSGPSTTEGTVTYRGGRLQGLTLDLVFSDDPAVQDAFMVFASAQDGLFSGDVPSYSEETGPAWLEAAREFGEQ
jgi:hypothetical protein